MPYETVIIDAKNIIEKCNLGSGNSAADLGTGREARFALAAAKAVGQDGKVYAVDIVKSLLPSIKHKADMYGYNNIETVWSDLEIYGATKVIPDNSLDAAFLATVLFQSKNHPAMMREAVRMLRPRGKLAVVDWKNLDTSFGPPMEQRVNPESIKQIAQDLNLEFVEEFEAGENHWAQIYQK